MAEAEATPSEISWNSQKFEKQFSRIFSYFLELNASIPASFLISMVLFSYLQNDFSDVFVCFHIFMRLFDFAELECTVNDWPNLAIF